MNNVMEGKLWINWSLVALFVFSFWGAAQAQIDPMEGVCKMDLPALPEPWSPAMVKAKKVASLESVFTVVNPAQETREVFSFDKNGRMTEHVRFEKDFQGKEISYKSEFLYNKKGQLIAKNDARDLTWDEYTYDDKGRLQSWVRMTDDGKGLKSKTDQAAAQYDAEGRLVAVCQKYIGYLFLHGKEEWPVCNDSKLSWVMYRIDANGEVAEWRKCSGAKLTFEGKVVEASSRQRVEEVVQHPPMDKPDRVTKTVQIYEDGIPGRKEEYYNGEKSADWTFEYDGNWLLRSHVKKSNGEQETKVTWDMVNGLPSGSTTGMRRGLAGPFMPKFKHSFNFTLH